MTLPARDAGLGAANGTANRRKTFVSFNVEQGPVYLVACRLASNVSRGGQVSMLLVSASHPFTTAEYGRYAVLTVSGATNRTQFSPRFEVGISPPIPFAPSGLMRPSMTADGRRQNIDHLQSH